MGREALLMVADSYFQQKTAEPYTEARYRYRDYLNRYPGAPKRDYARYQFALCYDKEHEKPDRDQTATREAIEQYRALIREFPDSGYAGAGRERIRRLTDLLAEHDFGVGYFYLRKGSTAAALSRFIQVEAALPGLRRQGQALLLPGAWLSSGWGARTRPSATSGRSWRSSRRAITPRRRNGVIGNKTGEKAAGGRYSG